MQSLKFRKAELTDLDRLLHLINLAYRRILSRAGPMKQIMCRGKELITSNYNRL